MMRPSRSGSRLRIASTDLLEWGWPRRSRKIGRVFNFHLIWRLDLLDVLVHTVLLELLVNLAVHFRVRLRDPLVHADQVEAVGLLHRLAHFALLESENGGLHRLRVGTAVFDGSDLAVLGGCSLVFGVLSRQIAVS